MSKHLTLSHLQTILPPIKHLIDKKAEAVDWNENDSSAKGYIKNRPFYERKDIQILLEGDFTPTDSPYIEVDMIPLISGQEYCVIFNETKYQTIAQEPESGFVFIGNPALFGLPVSDEPFAVATSTIEGYSMITSINLETGPSMEPFSIVISTTETIIKKIDPKFLPELGQGTNIGAAGTGEGAEIFNNYEINIASGVNSHAEGNNCTASGDSSHAEGNGCIASGDWASHAEGLGAIASGNTSHAEGYYTTAASPDQHVQGKYNIVDISSTYAHIVGNGSSRSNLSNAHALDWDGNAYFAGEVYVNGDGANNFANNKKLATEEFVTNQISTIPNNGNILNGSSAGSLRTINSAVNDNNYTIGMNSFSQGNSTFSIGANSHSEGSKTCSAGLNSHAEGSGYYVTCLISGAGAVTSYRFSEPIASNLINKGDIIKYKNKYATITGGAGDANGANISIVYLSNTLSDDEALTNANAIIFTSCALGESSHVEGMRAIASGTGSHAEGIDTKAIGSSSHAEGMLTQAIGIRSHAEGSSSVANGASSHAEGILTIATGDGSHAQGKYNIEDTEGKYAHIVGNGTAGTDNARSNAHTLDWSGNAWFAGEVYVGGTDQDSGEKLAKMSDLASITTDEIDVICGVVVQN